MHRLAAADDESANQLTTDDRKSTLGDVRPRDPDCIGIGDCDCRGNGEANRAAHVNRAADDIIRWHVGI